MAVIKFTASQLQAKRDAIQREIGCLKTQREELKGESYNLLDAWEGDAAEAFEEDFDASYDEMGICIAYMEEYVKALDTVIATYAAVEAANKLIAKFK